MFDLRLGTSGWHYKHWYGIFYPPKLPASEMLPFFMERFNTVEINNTFYALPLESTVRRWYSTVPHDFCFAVKGSRFITHVKKLKDPQEPLKRFMPVVENLREKLGPILFQFPRTWQLNFERAEEFLNALPRHHKYVFEFRHSSWNVDKVYELLRAHNSALCIYDYGGITSPKEITADFTYVRLHGGADHGNYSNEDLKMWARRIGEWSASLKSVYFYFNNDLHGHALYNAFYLRRILQSEFGIDIRLTVSAPRLIED